ncbi:MAG: 5'-methylthioadenosine/S-adenosylhomocysteine nucleosidase [Thiotrichales bacterium]|nr:5'-methylthioadenosine/S-adenosylhomocysteine nucleosidase [Thiotrichales bacterium]MCY4284767.1 5'-methylthioadenosine/S-adenosylhomocysteine nucleosidase [Thiotrichales bacterium]MCY4350069.1 5'-methylthioadenosine/S-adenosylhomocysteine nucleosidase [Thiotrichales bacterium]
MKLHAFRSMAVRLAVVSAGLASAVSPAAAHDDFRDDTRRIAVVSAYAPEMSILRSALRSAVVHEANGVEFATGELEGRDVVLFLSGVSIVNAAMTMQLALDHFEIGQIVFSGIAGGVDPALDIGDVVIADRWGQYLETLFAREVDDDWSKVPFFDYPFANFGMMFPRSLTVLRSGADTPETRFWFPVDEPMLDRARAAVDGVVLDRCTAEHACLPRTPRIVVGGAGVSGGAFVDNAAFRAYTFETFGARVLDMESAAVAHVAWSNRVPFIAVRSLADLAGGRERENELEVFFQLAADNAATVVRALLRAMPE